MVLIADPVYTQELLVTNDKYLEKHDHARFKYTDIYWNGILFAKSGGPTYRPRRKLITHAYFASKMKAMSDMIADVIHECLSEWETRFPTGKLDLISEIATIVA